MVQNQANLFLIFTIDGFIIGLVFDIFRILRKSFKTSDFITYIEDVCFWLITGGIVLYSTFVFNNGEIRFFMFIGILLGTLLYMLLISKYIIKFTVMIIDTIKKVIFIILKIVVFPINLIYETIKKSFSKPVLLVIINIKKIIRQIKTKFLKQNFKKQKNMKKSKKMKNIGGK